jgi:cytochrome c556
VSQLKHNGLKDMPPLKARKKMYEILEEKGEAQEAIWEALQILKATGLNIGSKADAVLANRDQIKLNIPKE